MKNIKNAIQPIAIITFALLVTTLMVGMIAYANCEEAKVLIDNLMGNPLVEHDLPQA